MRGPAFNQHCTYLLEGIDGSNTYKLLEQDMKLTRNGVWMSNTIINLPCASYPAVSEWRWTISNVPTGLGNGFWLSQCEFYGLAFESH